METGFLSRYRPRNRAKYSNRQRVGADNTSSECSSRGGDFEVAHGPIAICGRS